MSGRDARRAREQARAEATSVRAFVSQMRWEGPAPEEALTARELFALFDDRDPRDDRDDGDTSRPPSGRDR